LTLARRTAQPPAWAPSPVPAADSTTLLLPLLLPITLQVTDFTLTRVLDAGKTHCSTTSLGTITHVAPEVLLSGKQTKAGDVYSYGLLSECLD
jgi:serine/threonine protein kinase